MLLDRHALRQKLRQLRSKNASNKPVERLRDELIARIEVMLRRRRSEKENLPPLTFGNVTIDRIGRVVTVNNELIQLSAREFDLLCLLAATPGTVYSRDTILERVWGWDYEGTARTVDNFIANLRKKLQPNPKDPQYIQTIPRIGYRLEGPK